MKRTFSVPRIHCSGCVNTVERALQAVPGVTSAEGNEDRKTVDVVWDPAQVSTERIKEALANIGYPAAS